MAEQGPLTRGSILRTNQRSSKGSAFACAPSPLRLELRGAVTGGQESPKARTQPEPRWARSRFREQACPMGTLRSRRPPRSGFDRLGVPCPAHAERHRAPGLRTRGVRSQPAHRLVVRPGSRGPHGRRTPSQHRADPGRRPGLERSELRRRWGCGWERPHAAHRLDRSGGRPLHERLRGQRHLRSLARLDHVGALRHAIRLRVHPHSAGHDDGYAGDGRGPVEATAPGTAQSRRRVAPL